MESRHLAKRPRHDGLGLASPETGYEPRDTLPPDQGRRQARENPWEEEVSSQMLERLPIIPLDISAVIDQPALTDAHLREDGLVRRTSDGAQIGMLEKGAVHCLLTVSTEIRADIQFMFQTESIPWGKRTKATAFASAILYGPMLLADYLGDFIDQCGLTLQEPYGCDYNVPYLNPHYLGALFQPRMMTYDIQRRRMSGLPKQAFSPNEFFAAFETQVHSEQNTPSALKTELLHVSFPADEFARHQRQALSFFIKREVGGFPEDLWTKTILEGNRICYENNITHEKQNIPPPAWSGGILADEMGLGKTLQMISLIAVGKVNDNHIFQAPTIGNYVKSTLVVVTPSRKRGYQHHPVKVFN
ncbi:unnamed protein product [Clonostachys rosea]|uniref:SNF2 N-terminal domain-containing protein n=1 Tax=Bionectria ochroleuca TaxID=29856 RepID=A0ABY6UGV0_BIOOC|nr:unnamed protein product [Clonostachys rosea]